MRKVSEGPARSKNPGTHETFPRENREIPGSPGADGTPGRDANADGGTASVHETGKSDGPVLPAKLPNNAANAAAEVVEERGPAKGNAVQQNAVRTQSRETAPSALDRVRQRARHKKGEKFTSLLHHVTVDRLRVAFLSLSRTAAAGMDEVTWAQYAQELEDNLADLHGRIHRGAYRAKPSRRVFIPKADGGPRPLGIASLEDKLVQRTVVEVLNAIYEQDFVGFSHGFRPGRSQHDALDALAYGIVCKKVNWVLDADIRGFFDAIDHGWMQRFLEHRVADRRVLRLIQKWLSAGILQEGRRLKTSVGSPQGATVSPLLANIYLHYVFDLWAHQWRTRHATGEMIIVRYADDIVVGFEKEDDGQRFWAAMGHRLKAFALELHPQKTRLLRFGRFAAGQRVERKQSKPETFDFLGFTHICGRSKNGGFSLVRHTVKKRMRATLRAIKDALRRGAHRPIPLQGLWLQRKLRGYYQYFAVPTNIALLGAFRTEVEKLWLRTLRRRSQRHCFTWARMHLISSRWLPRPRALHPFPNERFVASTQRKSPVR